ncbi:2-hydroxyacid dehydrogenase [Moesziomyces antarcticus]|uniref:2-hydroxyacid dehydrogenase n=1 Tax=Pseudozyma antarctica TaxID=84753 RepID=A0A081CLP9_PSEA2|nr:2-hydroxyacid dehydrogenase [Moesziomyces antarcticus]GAK67595.1 2-hydroxyacid dehydrogenase [Moesziomyces antarcticus]
MVTVAFLPAARERCCLDIDSLIRTLPASIRVTRHVDAATDALVWLPNIAQGNTAPEVAALLEGSNVKWVQLPMTGVDDYTPIIRATRGKIHWSCAKPPPDTTRVDTLHGKQVVMVGNGTIATALVKMLPPLGCVVSPHDSASTPEWEKADIVVLACPLTATTMHLCNSAMLRQLRPGALLVNVARGEVVHTPALISAIRAGLKAAVDVLDESQLDAEQKEEMQKLVREGRLLVTPHSAVPMRIVPQVLGERIRQNLVRIEQGTWDDCIGTVDPDKGY